MSNNIVKIDQSIFDLSKIVAIVKTNHFDPDMAYVVYCVGNEISLHENTAIPFKNLFKRYHNDWIVKE